MKCYFCLTAPDSRNEIYSNLFKLSLKSALENTDLEMVIMYDGDAETDCSNIMNEYQARYNDRVRVIPHRFSLEEDLKSAYSNHYIKMVSENSSLKKISGAFMRLDVPFVEEKDEFVLYTDIDVYFNKNLDTDKLAKPKFLAAAPEFEKDILNLKYFNSGVMLLNVENMRNKCKLIFEELKTGKIENSGLLDQGLLNKYCFNDMDILPLEYNWKPYWGINPDARIIHFHGMKPGGNFSNSGFAMTEKILVDISNIYPESIPGLVFYSELFFEKLGKSSSDWVPFFVSKIFELNKKGFKNLNHVSSKELKNILKIYLKERINKLICRR